MISVPSSSGKSLQLFLLAGKNEKMSNFSPLFIGEITSTVGKFQLKLTNAATFQSPLHRGNHFNRPRSWLEALHRNFSPLFIGEITSTYRNLLFFPAFANFSPLFIGEITSTSFHLTTAYTPTKFQSPLHRGNHFNCCKAMTDGAVTPISVPSSSGKSLQQRHGKR